MLSRWLCNLLLLLATSVQASPEIIPLWPSLLPVKTDTLPYTSAKGAVTHVNAPFLRLIKPEHPLGRAVLIAAGGGYKRIEQAKEAIPAAHFLAEQGYNAYILTYRLPTEGWPAGNDVALQDAQRALKIVSAREQHLTVLGFSAGAHLLGLAINRPTPQHHSAQDSMDRQAIHVEGAALIYPIVTLEAPYSHTSTHHVLLGRTSTPQQERAWSLQTYIHSTSAPLFIVQAADDPIASPANSQILYQAALRQGVPVELHRFLVGGHGFGLGQQGSEVAIWPQLYLRWLNIVQRLQIKR